MSIFDGPIRSILFLMVLQPRVVCPLCDRSYAQAANHGSSRCGWHLGVRPGERPAGEHRSHRLFDLPNLRSPGNLSLKPVVKWDVCTKNSQHRWVWCKKIDSTIVQESIAKAIDGNSSVCGSNLRKQPKRSQFWFKGNFARNPILWFFLVHWTIGPTHRVSRQL